MALALPFTRKSTEADISLIDTIFIATSATCVTGLTTIDIASTFNPFGQFILLILIQTGGLGIMSMGAIFLVIAGHRLSLHQQRLIIGSWGKTGTLTVKNILIYIFTFVLGAELIAALLLFLQLKILYPDLHTITLLWQSFFHAVSAFCNAGITIFSSPNGELPWTHHELFSLTMSSTVILGSLGILTLVNLTQLRPWKRNRLERGTLTLQSKIALTMTLLLLIGGSLFYAAFEWHNTLSQANSWHEKFVWSFFQSAMSRTAGFTTVDVDQLHPVTLFATIILMFIGGAPGSMAGGIKTITFAILLASAWAALRRQQNTHLFHRRISRDLTNTALMITLLALTFIALVIMTLMVTEIHSPSSHSPHQWLAIVFEAVSAFATVGLSTGITPHLSPLGKITIILTMFIGRVGPLMLAIYLTKPLLPWHKRYPKENLSMG
ncbi:MAG: hypothetical protein NZM04_01660 [Methylacidiphilales bacterium]|nr:hypothetical protein [Candidatus Methylacidiphilales bacterium]MDW8349009.1 potassium transporter TrkG [Verrucomicrobiae bacterium]